MKLTVERLGLIKRAEFDIRPLTVFIGPNGTNKTWVAYALYGLMRNVSGSQWNNLSVKSSLTSGNSKLRKAISAHARPIANSIKAGAMPMTPAPVPAESYRGLRAAVVLQGWPGFFSELLRLWGRSTANAWAELQLAGEELQPAPNATGFFYVPPQFATEQIQENVEDWLARKMFSHEVFVLPAERKALASTHDLLRGEFDKVVSLPLADYAEFLKRERDFAYHRIERKGARPLAEMAGLLETSIVQGTIGFTGADSVFAFHPSKKLRLPIHTASSLVRAVAGLDLCLKNQAKPGDLVVIDELEMNAHPEAQLALTEFVAMLVNRGLRVVMTTHSPYVVEHLNNLMAAARVPSRKQEELASHFRLKRREAFLPSDKVAAYGFTPSGKEVKVSDVLDRKEDTIDWRTFSRITDELGDIYGHILMATKGRT